MVTLRAAAILALVVAILVMVAWVLKRAGLFEPIVTKTTILGPYMVVYDHYTGPYSQVPEAFGKLKSALIDVGLIHVSERNTIRCLGVYLDDPNTTPAAQCRAYVGWVFKHGEQVTKPEDVERARNWLNALSIVKTGELKVAYIPASACLAVSGDYAAGWLSFLVGLKRVYPKLKAELANRRIDIAKLPGSLEVYEPLDNRWTISFPLSKWPAEGGLSGPFPSPPSFAASGLNGLDKKRA